MLGEAGIIKKASGFPLGLPWGGRLIQSAPPELRAGHDRGFWHPENTTNSDQEGACYVLHSPY